eukprot:165130-Rhodomonas_salina.2
MVLVSQQSKERVWRNQVNARICGRKTTSLLKTTSLDNHDSYPSCQHRSLTWNIIPTPSNCDPARGSVKEFGGGFPRLLSGCCPSGANQDAIVASGSRSAISRTTVPRCDLRSSAGKNAGVVKLDFERGQVGVPTHSCPVLSDGHIAEIWGQK